MNKVSTAVIIIYADGNICCNECKNGRAGVIYDILYLVGG
jgi:hypothetical protein